VRSFSYDGAGNVAADTRGSTTYNYAYNKRDRLAKLTIGSTVTADYTYDGLERLAIRTTSNMTPAGTTQYVYDLAGRLIAEADSSGNTLTEYVWLDDMPLAVVANVDTSPTLYFVHADHLNRPIRMTDGSESVVWDAVYNPFGDVNSINGSASNNMRFPGQYFLIEDGLHYNWYRHYDPTIGRYTQPDPLGFVDGPSIYVYAKLSPQMYVDPNGKLVGPLLRTLEGLGRICIFWLGLITGDPNLKNPPPPPQEPPKIERPAPPIEPPSAPPPEPPPPLPRLPIVPRIPLPPL